MQETSAHDETQAADILARAYLDALAQADGIKMKRSMLSGHRAQSDLVDEVLDDLDPGDGRFTTPISPCEYPQMILCYRYVGHSPRDRLCGHTGTLWERLVTWCLDAPVLTTFSVSGVAE